MITTFEERERAAERRFVLEEEARFLARNRRNRLLATWACERMALSGPAAEAYITAFTECAVVADDETMIARLRSDLAAAGIGATLPLLREEMERSAALTRAERRVGVALDQGPSV